MNWFAERMDELLFEWASQLRPSYCFANGGEPGAPGVVVAFVHENDAFWCAAAGEPVYRIS